MTVFEAIKKRVSVRSYLNRPIEKEIIEQILEAGRLAPTASNQQQLKFMVVTDDALRLEMVDACSNQEFVANAPAILVICATKERTMRCGQAVRPIDSSIALSFMMLEAVELGLGTCWLGDFYSEKVRQVLNIPDDYSIIAVAPIGYPENTNQRPMSRKSQNQLVIYDRWM